MGIAPKESVTSVSPLRETSRMTEFGRNGMYMEIYLKEGQSSCLDLGSDVVFQSWEGLEVRMLKADDKTLPEMWTGRKTRLFPASQAPQNELILGEGDWREKRHQSTYGHQCLQRCSTYKRCALSTMVLVLGVPGFATNFPGPLCQRLFQYCNKTPKMTNSKEEGLVGACFWRFWSMEFVSYHWLWIGNKAVSHAGVPKKEKHSPHGIWEAKRNYKGPGPQYPPPKELRWITKIPPIRVCLLQVPLSATALWTGSEDFRMWAFRGCSRFKLEQHQLWTEMSPKEAIPWVSE